MTDPLQTLRDQGVDLNQPASQAAQQEGAPVPGTEQPAPTPPAEPTAGSQNAETTQRGEGPPESVPYSRFKEVNDQLRSYKELEGYGYDADSLHQLVQWGVQFDTNPVDSWLAVAKELDDLPPDVKEVVEAHLNTQSAVQPQQSSGDSEDGEEPAWAQELKERLDAREAEEARAERAKILDGLVGKWKEADKKDGLATIPEEKIYTYISSNAPRAKNEQELFDLARQEYMELREFHLQSTVKPGEPRAPVTVPGSGAPVQEAPPRPRTLAEASAQAEADMTAGTFNKG
jgi:hypothetical protein